MSKKQALRIGVVGCGIMGRIHTTNLSRMKGVSVVAVVDTDVAKAAALGAEFKVAFYDSAQAMLADVPVDVVIIATPPEVRWEIVRAATANRQATFIEKPIALNLHTAKACCVAVREGSLVSAVGFQLRYSPLTQQARDLISGRPVTHVRTACTTPYYLDMNVPSWYLQREHSGGPLLEQSIHVVDMARYLVSDITHVFARGDRLVRPDLNKFDCEDTIVLTYQFANGALGTHIDSSAMTEFNWEVEVFGPNWRLLADYARNRLCGHIDGEIIEQDFPAEDLHMLEMQAFLETVRNHKTNDSTNGVLSDFVDATKTLAVVLAGDRSLQTGVWEPVGE